MKRLVSWTALACVVAIVLSWSALAAQAQSRGDSLLPVPDGIDLTHNVRYSFVPDDPYYSQQWHLSNTSGYPSVNVVPVWNRGVTGSGVTIGIVDDGLEHSHSDLNPNYVAADSWNFGQNNSDPSPVHNYDAGPPVDYGDSHGTAVAGVAAARGGNGLGVTGAAPYAGLAGLRIDFPTQTEQMFVDATEHHSSGANTNIKVKNHSYGVPVGFIPSVAQVNALATSAAAGTIHVAAAGNERDYHEDSWYYDGDANKKHFQSSPDSIAVAALSADGAFSYYSNWGANVFVTAPSNDSGNPGILTTDRAGTEGYNPNTGDPFGDNDYTSVFGGTSSAAPLVAGIMALGKEVYPGMDVRAAKHLLARTSVVVDPGDTSPTGGWQTNAAGYHFNQNYGFGLIDADAFTSTAALALGVTPLATEHTGLITVNQAIPDGFGGSAGNPTPGASVVQPFSLSSSDPLEEVQVYLDIDHTWRGDLEALLTSPSGTISRLFYHNMGDDGALGVEDKIDWTFTTNEFWGESPLGDWSLSVYDVYAGDVGTWNRFSVTARMGDLLLIPEPSSAFALLMGIGAMGLFFRRRRVTNA